MTPALRGIFLSSLLLLPASRVFAQHDMEHMNMSHAPKPIAPAGPGLFDSDMRRMNGMMPVDPMGGMAMHGWGWMTAGLIRFGYNRQGGDRGDDAWESTNWVMGMAHHDLGPGRVTFMLMNSLEAATIDDPGSPQLFQTGETFEGKPIVDFQHPHDFFMHISGTYRATISPRAGLWAQFALVGEPALGPVAFMHRASSGDNPSAPLGHHWQDSTHITDDVITAGGGWSWLALDGSAFHGREPGEERWNIDGGPIDSYSGRVSVELPKRWSGQVSYGDIHDLHAEMPGDVKRTTASLHYGAAGDGPMALSFVWGRNDEVHGISDSFLAEYAHQIGWRHELYARAEWVEKDEQLLLTRVHIHDNTKRPTVDVTALTLGYLHSGTMFAGLGVGGDVTVYGVPSSLKDEYGDFPVSIHLFIRARWMSEF
jgi:hypothetical protein